MKLRVRVKNQTHRVELETEEPTLSDLNRELSESLLPSLGYSSDTPFIITLNGKDALIGDPDTLTSCGIISGDLLIVVLPETAAVLLPTQQSPSHPPLLQNHDGPPSMPSCSDQASGSVKDQQMEKSCVCEDRTGMQGSGMMVMMPEHKDFAGGPEEVDMEEGPGGYPSDPMLCSEAVDGRVPHSLETLYHQAGCTNTNEALVVVLHLLMLETGYLHQGCEGKAVSMPETWRSGGVYNLHYTHPLCDDGSARLTCVPMGNLLVVNATLKISNNLKSVKRLQLSPTSFISPQEQEDDVAGIYKDLQKLSRLVKDQLVYPLLASARQALNLPDVFGLVVLPLELKLRILRLLDTRSVLALSAVCRDMYVATNDPSLWRFLYLRDFRGAPSAGTTDWLLVSQRITVGMLPLILYNIRLLQSAAPASIRFPSRSNAATLWLRADSISRPRDTDWKEIYCMKYKQKKEALKWRHMFFQPPPPHPLPLHPNPFYIDPFSPRPMFPPGIIGGEYDERPVFPYVGDPINSLIPGAGQTPGRFLPFRPHFDPIGLLPDANPTLPGRAGPRSNRGRPSDIRRAFI